jgi:transcription elongation factor
MSLVMNPSEGGNDGYGYGGTYYGGELVQTQGDALRGRNADQDSGDEFLSEMARIRQDQTGEAAPPTPGRYKQKLEAARQESAEPDNTGYRYPGYKARRRESLSAEDEPSSTPAPAVPAGDVFSQVRTRRQEDLLKAARTRKKTKEKKKAFGDQIKGVLAYLPFRTSHLSGFDG